MLHPHCFGCHSLYAAYHKLSSDKGAHVSPQVKEVVRVRTQKKAKLSRPAGLPDKMGIRMPAGALKAIKGEKQKAEEAREKRLQELMKICLTILRQVGS